jgi:hypothetical protein
MRERGVTIIFVSHSVADIHAIGDRALWLEHGRVREIGDAGAVVASYLAAVAGEEQSEQAVKPAGRDRTPCNTVALVETIPNIDHRWGDGRATLLGIELLDEFGDPLRLMIPRSGIVVRMSLRANASLPRPDIGVRLRNHLGLDFAATSATREGHPAGPMRAGETMTVNFHFEIPELYPGAFSFSPWIEDTGVVCDAIDNAITVQMARGDGPVYGYVQVPCRIELNPLGVPISESENQLA